MKVSMILSAVLLCATIASNELISAAEPLPKPAIEGLRYYYPPEEVEKREIECDVCVYGGTSGGVVAAVQAARMGKKAVLLEFGKHVGGLSSGGLSHTDGGGAAVCGGVAREFYAKIGQSHFRPSEAEAAFHSLLKEAGVPVYYLAHLDKVEKKGARIVSLTMEDGLTVRAKQFIDCTYEGDLLARAGVSWTAGREANEQYDETFNGIRKPATGGHNWPTKVDPYVKAGDPTSGLLPRVNDNPGNPGDGDDRIQAFCFRMWLTKKDPTPFPKPTVYDPQEYELLARLFESGANPSIQFSLDTNNHHLFRGAYFIDYVGGNYDWPNADWAERERIFQAHANYQIGVMWFLSNSDRIPEKYQAEFKQWGLPKQDYVETSGWTHQLYIREGRRMVSDYVMTQHNCQGREVPTDSIGLASYNMDSHHCQMTVVDGAVCNEGNVEIGVDPYPISYRAIVPKREECVNLTVPVALSSTHIAFGSIRMEPVFMLLGQSAATAACQAIDQATDIQTIDYEKLKTRLLADRQILEYIGPKRRTGNSVDPKTLKGQIGDNETAKIAGDWVVGHIAGPHIGATYLHDDNKNKGELSARFEVKIEKPGSYEVRLAWPPNANRATNVPITVEHADGDETIELDQRKSPGEDGFRSLGTYSFRDKVAVVVSNKATNGYVIADAIQVLPAKKSSQLNRNSEAPLRSTISQVASRQAAAEPSACESEEPAQQPNVLLIFADDLGYEMLGAYGGKEVSTPHLDALGGEGVRFARAYTSPVCTPSRMSLYTGTYVTRHKYYNVLPVHLGTRKAVDFSKIATLPKLLNAAGYATSVTGKWQLATLEFHPQHCRSAGFDSWCVWQIWKEGAKTTRYWDPCFNHDGKIRTDVADRYGPDVLADYVIDQMKSAVAAKKPFFIQHNMMLPHWPILDTPNEKRSGEPASLNNMTAYADKLVGKLVAAVDELGIGEDTYIIFAGDNGTDSKKPRMITGGDVRGGKTDLNDAGMHVPLLVRRKGVIAPGTVRNDLVDIADMLPTICELAGVEAPNANIDGISFATAVRGGDDSKRTFVTGGYGGKYCVFDGQWRLLSNGKRLIDCHQLPAEKLAEKGDKEAELARVRLEKVMQSLPK